MAEHASSVMGRNRGQKFHTPNTPGVVGLSQRISVDYKTKAGTTKPKIKEVVPADLPERPKTVRGFRLEDREQPIGIENDEKQSMVSNSESLHLDLSGLNDDDDNVLSRRRMYGTQVESNPTEIDGRPKTSHGRRRQSHHGGVGHAMVPHPPPDDPPSQRNRASSIDSGIYSERPKTRRRNRREQVQPPSNSPLHFDGPNSPQYQNPMSPSGMERNPMSPGGIEREQSFFGNPISPSRSESRQSQSRVKSARKEQQRIVEYGAEPVPTAPAGGSAYIKPSFSFNPYKPLHGIGKKPATAPPVSDLEKLEISSQPIIIDTGIGEPNKQPSLSREATGSSISFGQDISLSSGSGSESVPAMGMFDPGNNAKYIYKEKVDLPSEPNESEERIQLAIKLPNAKRIQRYFRPSEKLLIVLQFAENAMEQDFGNYDLVCSMPRKVFSDFRVLISETGLKNRTVLHLEENADDDDV